jgi:hypothetical protein
MLLWADRWHRCDSTVLEGEGRIEEMSQQNFTTTNDKLYTFIDYCTACLSDVHSSTKILGVSCH